MSKRVFCQFATITVCFIFVVNLFLGISSVQASDPVEPSTPICIGYHIFQCTKYGNDSITAPDLQGDEFITFQLFYTCLTDEGIKHYCASIYDTKDNTDFGGIHAVVFNVFESYGSTDEPVAQGLMLSYVGSPIIQVEVVDHTMVGSAILVGEMSSNMGWTYWDYFGDAYWVSPGFEEFF